MSLAKPKEEDLSQDVQHDEGLDKHERDLEPQQMGVFDKLSVWQAAKLYRKIGLVCFLAAFSASLDGYQGESHPAHRQRTCLTLTGSFNGSVVSNKGFIRQFNPGNTILDAKWVSAWGGTASAAQCLSQVAISFISDKFGRRLALWTTWLLLTAVGARCTSWPVCILIFI